MIVVDTWVIVALAMKEPVAPVLLARLMTTLPPELSMASYVEAATVLTPRGVTHAQIDGLLQRLQLTLIPVDERQAREAIRARVVHGEGSGHPARLSFCDDFSYALARTRDAPPLFIGDDFSRTDLVDAQA